MEGSQIHLGSFFQGGFLVCPSFLNPPFFKTTYFPPRRYLCILDTNLVVHPLLFILGGKEVHPLLGGTEVYILDTNLVVHPLFIQGSKEVHPLFL